MNLSPEILEVSAFAFVLALTWKLLTFILDLVKKPKSEEEQLGVQLMSLLQGMADSLKNLDDSHSGRWATRGDGSPRWHNVEAVEQATLENNRMLKAVLRILKATHPEEYNSHGAGLAD